MGTQKIDIAALAAETAHEVSSRECFAYTGGGHAAHSAQCQFATIKITEALKRAQNAAFEQAAAETVAMAEAWHKSKDEQRGFRERVGDTLRGRAVGIRSLMLTGYDRDRGVWRCECGATIVEPTLQECPHCHKAKPSNEDAKINATDLPRPGNTL